MDSLQDTIQSILSDKDQMKKVQAMADMLVNSSANSSDNPTDNNANSNNSDSNNDSSNNLDISSILSMLSDDKSSGSDTSDNNPSNDSDLLSGLAGSVNPLDSLGITPDMLFKLQKAFSTSSQPDERVSLLNALRPYLNIKRQTKLDKLIGFLKISKAAKAIGFDMNMLDILK